MSTHRHPLHTQRLRLEPTVVDHAPLVYDEMSDERLWTFFPELRPKSLEDLRDLYRRWERGKPNAHGEEVWENWICFLRDTQTPVGGMQASIFPEGVAYIAYAIYIRHQRQGYAREAAQALIEHLRSEHGVVRILAEMNTKNEASRSLVESLGFQCVEEHTDVERGHGIEANEYLYELKL